MQDGVIWKIQVAAERQRKQEATLKRKVSADSAGLIDMHVHFREPGFEHKETIETAARSAAKGGFTTIACMPNTRPVTDTVPTYNMVMDKADAKRDCEGTALRGITKNELGRELTDFAALKEAGAIGFTDDGVGVQSAQMMKDAMGLAEGWICRLSPTVKIIRW